MPGPNAKLDVSQACLELIAGFEGLRLTLYEDVAGHATIGVGHLVHQGNITAADKSGPFGKGITREQAFALLRQDAQRMVDGVRDCVTVPLNQNQFDALVSFAFNVGVGGLRRSNLLKVVNAKDFAHVEPEFLKWNKAGGKVYAGLTRRRKAEAALFLQGATPAKPAKPADRPDRPATKPATWPPARVLKRPLHGEDVKELQRRLHVNPDGVFGKDTEAAVKAVQRKHKLVDDGKVGPKTAAVL
jgi:lysozyme